jgi:tetratricopeptide (TPR) repeat protein
MWIPIRSIVLVLLLGMSSVSAAGTADFEQANRQFNAGDFAAAAASYEQILAAAGARATVLYNLGNSYQRLEQYGHAILAYERARLLTPRDPDLLANLALARKAAAAFEENGDHPRLDAAVNYLSRNEWSWLVAGAVLFLGGLAVLGGVAGMPRRGHRQAALTATAAAILAIIAGAAALYHRRDESSRAIVLTEDAVVRLSPFDKAETLGSPGLGRTVHIRGHSGGFHFIEVPGTNLRGWLPAKDVAAVTPE